MSAGCPKCGVAVIAGYVRCPRCQAALPGAAPARRSGDPGGTVVSARTFPTAWVIGGAAVVAVIALVVMSRGGTAQAPARATAAAASGAAEAVAPEPGAESAVVPGAQAASPTAQAGEGAPAADPRAAASELERVLGRQRLWSSVQASGTRVDVRSGSCDDPGMGPAIDAARAALRGAGLTQLRCLAQSGAVAFERDL